MQNTIIYERVLFLKKTGVRGGIDQGMGRHLVSAADNDYAEELLG